MQCRRARRRSWDKAGEPIQLIVSGGQTGADQGGLDAAIELGIPHRGWCPKGRKSEAGVIPSRYNLQETNSADYRKRTIRNVIDSSATLIFTYGPPTGGSRLTAKAAEDHNRPWLHVDLNEEDAILAINIKIWLSGEEPDVEGSVPPLCPVLNIAGSRESKAPGIQERVKNIIKLVMTWDGFGTDGRSQGE